MAQNNKKNYLSPLGLRINKGPNKADLMAAIEKKDDPAFPGLTLGVVKYAYNEQASTAVAMADRNNNGAPITGTIAAVVVQAIPISRNKGQYLLLCYAKSALNLNGQPIPVLDDDGKKALGKLKLSEATANLTNGIPANAYFTATYDTAAEDGEIRRIQDGNTETNMLSLMSLTGMDHRAIPPLPGACIAPIYDEMLTFGGGGGNS